MNFIDISSWQYGLDLDTLFKNNNLDGVIVKSSGGVSYVQSTCDKWIQFLHKHNKPFGFYHYLNDDNQGASGALEARYFVQNTKSYFGFGMPFADYEGEALKKGTKYLLEFLETVYLLTNVRCGVYTSLSVIQSQDFSEIAKNYPLWVAQYADFNQVNGFLESPWLSGSVSPFNRFIIHQYTSCGHLKGWNGNLDFDKVYLTKEEWEEMCKGKKPDELKGPDATVVSEVLSGRYGTNEKRRKSLIEAGYDPDKVQKKINEIYELANQIRPILKGNMEYINSIVKVVKM